MYCCFEQNCCFDQIAALTKLDHVVTAYLMTVYILLCVAR